MNKQINLENKIFFDIQILGKLLTIESAASLLYLLLIPGEAAEAVFLGFSKQRLILISVLLIITLSSGILTFIFLKSNDLKGQITDFLFQQIQKEQIRKLPLQVISMGLVISALLLIFWANTSDQYYLGILSRIGPFLILATLASAQLIYFILSRFSKEVRQIWGESIFASAILTIFQWSIIAETHQRYSLSLVFGLLVFIAFSSYFLANLTLTRSTAENKAWLLPVVILFILLLPQLQLIPKSFWRFRERILLFLPAALLLAFLLAHILSTYLSFKKNKQISFALLAGVFVLLVFLGTAYYDAAIDHSININVDYKGDQRSFMGFTEDVYNSGFTNTGNRNQMPAYPFIQALFYEPDNNLDELFLTGKEINILLSLFLLALLFAIFRFFFSLHQSLNLLLVVAFASFIFRSPYFKVEILFYFLNFIAFLLMALMIAQPTIKLGIVTGLVLGLTHLSKASIIPGIVAFVFVIFVKEITQYYFKGKISNSKRKQIANRKNEITGPLLVIIFFIATISPYVLESKKDYGEYFYNVNYFVMWYDTWEEAEIARDQYGFHNIPENEIPSIKKYLANHSFNDFVERIQYGVYRQSENFRYQFNLFHFPVFFLAYLLIMLLLQWRKAVFLIKKNIFLASFVLFFMAGYLILFVWYSPIVGLTRFIYGLFIPFLFSIFVAIKSLSRESDQSITKFMDIAVSAMLIFDIPYVLSTGLFLGSFGS